MANALPIGTTLTVYGTGATYDLNGYNQQVAGLSDNGLSAGTVTDSGAAATLTCNNSGTNTFSGTVSGPLSVTESGAGTQTLSGPNITFTGDVTVNAGKVTLFNTTNFATGTATQTFTTATGATLELHCDATQNIGSTGGLTFAGTGTLLKTGGGILNNNISSTHKPISMNMSGGLIDIEGGGLLNGGWQSFDWTNNLASMNIANGATLDLSDGNTVYVDALTGSGSIDSVISYPHAASITVGVNNGSGTFSGNMKNSFGALYLTKSGTGTETLTGTIGNNNGGTTTITGGTLLVNGTMVAGMPVTVNNGGTLGGNGTVLGTVYVVSGGVVSPGISAATTGILNTNNVTFADNTSSFTVQLNGTTAGTLYSQLQVAGSATLASCTLNASLGGGYTPNVGDTLTILTTTSGITDTFNGLAEGATTDISGYSFQVSYAGGNAVLTCVAGALVDHFKVVATNGGNIGPQYSGTPFNIEIIAQTQSNATAGSFSGTVTITATGSLLSGSPVTSLAFINGVLASQSVTLTTNGNAVTLTATMTGGSQTGTSNAFTVSNPPAQLVFTVSPSSSTGGVPFGTQPVVTVLDAYGNTVTTDTSNVTLAIGTNPSGGTLGGVTTVAAVNGVATFSSLSVNKPGTGYTLTASDGALTGATSSAFDIAIGAAAQLGFTTSPDGATAGTAFTQQPVVAVQDAGGNTIVGDNTTSVTLTISSNGNPGGGTLSGTITATVVNGVATFSGLSINKSGAGYTLTATDDSGALNSGTSSAFTVSPAALDHFKVEAAGGGNLATQTAGIATKIKITAQDAYNNTVTGFTGTVSITAANATLSGAPVTSGAFTAGVLASQSLMFTSAGSGVKLTAASGGKTGTSNAFTVNAQPTFTSPPVVTPNPIIAGQTLHGQASATSGTVTWDFGDGVQQTTQGGATVTHTYGQPGIYTLTVTPLGGNPVTYQVFVSFGLAATAPLGTATPPAGATGIIVGSSGLLPKGGSGKLICNYTKPLNSSFTAKVGYVSFPWTVQQAQLTNQAGVLTLGSGTTALTFPFTLDKHGKGKAGGLSALMITVKTGRIQFKVNKSAGMNNMVAALGGVFVPTIKKGTPVKILLPATLQVDSVVYVALTFQMTYVQSGKTAKAATGK